MNSKVVTARGVYKDLSLSPYEYKTPYGASFKFPSSKRLEMYTRDVEKEIERLNKALTRNGLLEELQKDAETLETLKLLHHLTYRNYYNSVEG